MRKGRNIATVQHSSATPAKRSDLRAAGARVPVVLFEGALTGSGAARILNQHAIPTCSVMNTPGVYGHSRHYHPASGIHGNVSPADALTVLAALEVPQAVLMPCADDWLRAIGALHLEEGGRFAACLPPLPAIEALVDKQRFARLVSDVGLPHPNTRIIDSLDTLQRLSDEEFRGYFLKPTNSLEFTRKHRVKALLVADRASAMSSADEGDFPILLQEYIPGPATAHYFIDGFIDRHGRTCALFARRRLRMYPPKVGNSSLLISIPLKDIQPAADALLSMLKSIHYRGIFSAEFKYDERDRQYKILEVNARPWWYVEFAARCGVDVCTMAYHDALGIDVEPVFDYQVGRRCVHLSNDIAGFRDHTDGFPRSFLDWATSVAGADEPLFRWSDPVPSIANNFKLIVRELRRLASGPSDADSSDASKN